MHLCFNCGKKEGNTRDHVPPKNLFPIKLRKNLITVPCCEECHKKFKLDDEAFRIYVSASINRSTVGEEIWNNKVIGSSFKRSKKLKQNVQKSLIPLYLPTKQFSGFYGLTIPANRVNKYLERITKALIRHFFSEHKLIGLSFEVIQINPADIKSLLDTMNFGERGEGTFKFWYKFNDKKSNSIWIYQFYDAIMFAVIVSL